MKVEIIIPSYNGFGLVKKNLPAVIKSLEKYKDSKVTIVDDGSNPDEQKELDSFVTKVNKDSKIKISLMLFQENKGFSSNVNRAAMISDAEIFVLLNTDVEPSENFLDPLLVHFKDKKIFGVGCMDKSLETKTVLRGRGVGEWKRGFLIHSKGEVDKSDTFWVSGGSSAFNRKIFQELGGMDNLYDPFYWEDIDLSYRAQKAGYKVIFESKSVVTHVHKKGSIRKHFKDDTIKSYAMRNQFTFMWKNITDTDLLISHFIWLPYHLLLALMRLDTIFIKGFTLAVFRLPAIIKRRSTQKKQYKLRDKEVIKKR